MPEYYSRTEVMRMLGVKSTQLWQLIRDRIVPAPIETGRPGGRRTTIRFPKKEIDDYLASRPRRLPKGSEPETKMNITADRGATLDLFDDLLRALADQKHHQTAFQMSVRDRVRKVFLLHDEVNFLNDVIIKGLYRQLVEGITEEQRAAYRAKLEP
jgi:predicted DNA-binding transcriptional regulator AlpA